MARTLKRGNRQEQEQRQGDALRTEKKGEEDVKWEGGSFYDGTLTHKHVGVGPMNERVGKEKETTSQ